MIPGERLTLWEGEALNDNYIVYGHWETTRGSVDAAGEFVHPPYVTYSDYSGSLVERSNLEEFVEQFADSRGVEWAETRGGHGTRGLIVRVDADVRVPEIGEFFAALDDYPLTNEERHSELEMEATTEAWNDYGLDDFIEQFDNAGLFENDVLSADEALTRDEATIRSALTSFYYAMSDLYSAYPEVEDAAGSVAFHVNSIIDVLGAFVDDINVAGEHGSEEEQEESEEGTFGPRIFEALLGPAIYGPNPQTDRFEYKGDIYRLLSGHYSLRWPVGKREVFTDLLRERGLDAGLEFLRNAKR